jgi:predicted Zn-dependent protease with MMP-like domain
MNPIDVDAFEALVADALEAIPDELRAEMENVTTRVRPAGSTGCTREFL